MTSLHRMSSDMLDLGMGHLVFPSQEVAALSPVPRATRVAEYMASDGSGHSRACYGFILQFVHELSVPFPEEAGFLRK